MRRRLLTEFLKDLLSRRWDLPQMRGLLAARRWMGAIIAMSDGELENWCPDMPRRIVAPAVTFAACAVATPSSA